MRTRRVTLLAGSTSSLFVMLFVAVQQAITLQAAASQSSTEHLAAPWLAPAGIQFPYEGLHNSLQQLVAVQAGGSGRVAVTFFTAAHQPMLLNHVYSMVKYGQATNYIVIVVDTRTLSACIKLRLPCYNASRLLSPSGTESEHQGEHTFGSPMWRKLTHLKPTLVMEVYMQGVSVLFSDADVTYLRPIWPSYDGIMQRTKADASFMNEFGRLNSGNFMLLHNNRTTKLLQAWVAPPPPGSNYLGDQEWLFSMDGSAFQLCSNADECERVQTSSGLAAIHPFTSQYNKSSWTGHCPGRRPWPACAPYTLFMHIICHSGLRNKVGWMKYYDLWHLEEDGFTLKKAPHPYLPCKDGAPAWQDTPVDPNAHVYQKAVYDDADDPDVKRPPP